MVDELYTEVRNFFNLPLETKTKYEIPGIGGQRGYVSFGKESAKGRTSGDLKEYLSLGTKKQPLHILNGKEISKEEIENNPVLNFKNGAKFTKYEGKEAIEKFGEKGKNGVIVIEGNVKYPEFEKKNNLQKQEELLKELNVYGKDKKPLYIINGKEILEEELKALNYNNIENITVVKDKESLKKYGNKGQWGIFDIKLKPEDKKIEERKQYLNETKKDREDKVAERQKKVNEREALIEARKKELEERRSMYDTFSIINKDSSDSDIESIKAKMQKQGIQMNVSNLKRNKNGEIYKIKISLTENSETGNNKRKAKSEATFERGNESIPNIFIGKQNGELIISNSISIN